MHPCTEQRQGLEQVRVLQAVLFYLEQHSYYVKRAGVVVVVVVLGGFYLSFNHKTS